MVALLLVLDVDGVSCPELLEVVFVFGGDSVIDACLIAQCVAHQSRGVFLARWSPHSSICVHVQV